MTEQEPSRERKSLLRSAFWIGLGLVVGIGAGLLVGWVLWPLEYTEADPSIMEDRYQRDYTLMIASAYSQDQDLIQARRRLHSLGMQDDEHWLLAVTVDHIVNGGNDVDNRHLVALAYDLGLYTSVMDPYLPGDANGDGG